MQDRWSEYRLLGLLTDREKMNEWFLPSDGKLCRLEIRCSNAGEREAIKVVFAYGVWSRIRPRKKSADVVYAKQLEEASIPGRRNHLNFVLEITVLVKRMSPLVEINRSKPTVCRSIARIKPMLRNFLAVENLPHSPLFTSIVCPSRFLSIPAQTPAAVADYFRPDVVNLKLFQGLNPSQTRVVKSVAHYCTSDVPSAGEGRWPAPTQPHISLIHGPPGTGKTSTIAALILQVLEK